MSSIKTYNLENLNDLQSIQLVVTNKNSSGIEVPTVQNGTISNYTWKRNNTILKSGSSSSFRYYTPVEQDVNQTISCEVTAISSYDSNIFVKKISYIQILFDVMETDIIVETDIVPETDIVVETDIVPETDIVIPETIFPNFRIAERDELTVSGTTEIRRINEQTLIGTELILVEKDDDTGSAPEIIELIENAQSIGYKWYYFNDVNETAIGSDSSYIITNNDIDQQISCKITVTGLDNNVYTKINIQGGTNQNYVVPVIINYEITVFSLNVEDDNGTIDPPYEISSPLEQSYYAAYADHNSEGSGSEEFIWFINDSEIVGQNQNILEINQDIIDSYFTQGNNTVKCKYILNYPDIPICYGEETDPLICPEIEQEQTINILLTIETDIVVETDVVPETDIVLETDIVPLFLNNVSLRRSDYPTGLGITMVDISTDSDLIDLFVADATNSNDLSPVTNFPPESLSYQWKKDGILIQGETSQFYTLQQNDINSNISCTVIVSFEGNVIQRNTQSVFIGILIDEGGWTVLNATNESRLIYIGDPNDPNDGDDTQAANNQYGRNYYTINDPIIGPDPTNPIQPSQIKSYKKLSEARKAFRNAGIDYNAIIDENGLMERRRYPDWFLFKRGCDYRKHYITDPSGYLSSLSLEDNDLNNITITITDYLNSNSFFAVGDFISRGNYLPEEQRFKMEILRVEQNGSTCTLRGTMISHGIPANIFTDNLFNITKNQSFNETSNFYFRYALIYPQFVSRLGHPFYGFPGIWGVNENAPAVITAWGSEILDRPKFNHLSFFAHSYHLKVTSLSVENGFAPDEFIEEFNTSNITLSPGIQDGPIADLGGIYNMIYFNNKIFVCGHFGGFNYRSNVLESRGVVIYDPDNDVLSNINTDNFDGISPKNFAILNNQLYLLVTHYPTYVTRLMKYNSATNSFDFVNINILQSDSSVYTTEIKVHNNVMYIMYGGRIYKSTNGTFFSPVTLNGPYTTEGSLSYWIKQTAFKDNFCYVITRDSNYIYKIDLITNTVSRLSDDIFYYGNQNTYKFYFIKIINNDLFVGGRFDYIGETPGYNNLARFNLLDSTWHSLNFPSSITEIIDITQGYNNNDYYIAISSEGSFWLDTNTPSKRITSYIKYNASTSTYESITEPSNSCGDILYTSHMVTQVNLFNRILKYVHNGQERIITFTQDGLWHIKSNDTFERVYGSTPHGSTKGFLLEDVYCKGNMHLNPKNNDVKIRRCVFSGSWLTSTHSQNIYVDGVYDSNTNLLLEECIFDNGGMKNNIWNSNFWVDPNNISDPSKPLNFTTAMSVYTRNIYSYAFINIRGCTFSRPSSGNIQARGGGCIERNLFMFSDSVGSIGSSETPPRNRQSGIIKSNVMIYENPFSGTSTGSGGGFGWFVAGSTTTHNNLDTIFIADDNIRTHSFWGANGGFHFHFNSYPIRTGATPCGKRVEYIPTNTGKYACIINNIVWTPFGMGVAPIIYPSYKDKDNEQYKEKIKYIENIFFGNNKILSTMSGGNTYDAGAFITKSSIEDITLQEFNTKLPTWRFGDTQQFKNDYCSIKVTASLTDDPNSIPVWPSTQSMFGAGDIYGSYPPVTFNDWKVQGYDIHSNYHENISSFKTSTGITNPERDLVSYLIDENSPGFDQQYKNLSNLDISDPNHPENIEFDAHAIIKRQTNRKKYWEALVSRAIAGEQYQLPTKYANTPQQENELREFRSKLYARKFHAFLYILNKMKQNRKGSWDSRFTSKAIIDYIREGFGKPQLRFTPYDTTNPMTRFQQYIDEYF